MRAYHFFGDTLRDGSPVPEDGVKLIYDGDIVLCESGYHASFDPFDALTYATGCNLAIVDVSGEIIHGDDELVASEMTIIKRINATQLLIEFARKMALDVVNLWNAPEVVVEYLKTGNEEIRKSAWAAARDAAREDAVSDAAWAAVWAAAREDAWEDAWSASWDAGCAAWAARDARDAQRSIFNEMVLKAFGEIG